MAEGRRNSAKKAPPGTVFFWSDWRADSAVQSVSYAAQGLWMNILCVMHDAMPRGVVSGDLGHVAGLLGVPGPLRTKWVEMAQPMIDELEKAGVFSIGRDVDARLESDALVCRRMFREFLAARARSEKASKAALMRHYKRIPDRQKSCSVPASAVPERCSTSASAMLGSSSEVMHDDSVTCSSSCSRDARHGARSVLGDCSARAIPDPEPDPDPDPDRNAEDLLRARPRVAERLGSVIARTFGAVTVTPDQMIRRIQAAAHDSIEYVEWWRQTVAALHQSAEAWGDLLAIVEYVESCDDPAIRNAKDLGVLRAPGRYLSSKAMHVARTYRIAVQSPPSHVDAATQKKEER